MKTTSTFRLILTIFSFSLFLLLVSCSDDEQEPEPPIDPALTDFIYDRLFVSVDLSKTNIEGLSFQKKNADGTYSYITSYTVNSKGNTSIKLNTDSFIDANDVVLGNGLYATSYVTDSDVEFEIVENTKTIKAKPSTIAITFFSHQKGYVMSTEQLAAYAVQASNMAKGLSNYKYYPN